MIRDWIRKYFSFNQTEVNGMMILVPLLFLILLAPTFYRSYLLNTQVATENDIDESVYLALSQLQEKELVQKRETGKVPPSIKPHPFDPNTVSGEELRRIGLHDRLVSTILNYRKKGGSFRIKSDLSKIYGLNQNLYQRLRPFIQLPDSLQRTPETPPFVKKELVTEIVKVDINLADTSQLKKVRGIGRVLSKRIVAYRERLGGFYSLDQLSEVYGLKDSVILKLNQRFFVTDPPDISRIDLLKTDGTDLKNHPYISYKIANLILAYRKQHEIQSVDQIKEIKVITDSIFRRMRPYLFVEPMVN